MFEPLLPVIGHSGFDPDEAIAALTFRWAAVTGCAADVGDNGVSGFGIMAFEPERVDVVSVANGGTS